MSHHLLEICTEIIMNGGIRLRQSMAKNIDMDNVKRGLFLTSKEDYMHKIERLVRLINEKYPELADSIEIPESDYFNSSDTLNKVIEYYSLLYLKIKDFVSPSYSPQWMNKTKFYS